MSKPQPRDELSLLDGKSENKVLRSLEKEFTTEKLYKENPQQGNTIPSTSAINVGQAEYMGIAKTKALSKKTVKFEDASDSKIDRELHKAARQGNIDKIHQLIKEGCDINKEGFFGRTALMLAAQYGHGDCVKELITSGADLEKMDSYGQTALKLAAHRSHEGCAKDLIDAGADLENKDCNGQTALMFATQRGQEGCCKYMIASGADLENKDLNRETALMFAAQYGHEGCVKALIDAGADLENKDCNGHTAVMLAAENSHESCVKALIAAGANLEEDTYGDNSETGGSQEKEPNEIREYSESEGTVVTVPKEAPLTRHSPGTKLLNVSSKGGLYYMEDADIWLSIPNNTVSSASEVIVISKPVSGCISLDEANILSEMITVLPHNTVFNQHVLVKFPLVRSKLHQDDPIELLYSQCETEGEYNWIRLQQHDTCRNHSDNIFWFTDTEYCYLFLQHFCHFILVKQSGKEEQEALHLCTSVHGKWNENDLDIVVGFHCPKCNNKDLTNQSDLGVFLKSLPKCIFGNGGPLTITVELQDEIWRDAVKTEKLSADILMLQCNPGLDIYHQSFPFLAKEENVDLNKKICGTVNLSQKGQTQGAIRFFTSLGQLMQVKSMVEAGTNTEKSLAEIYHEAKEDKRTTVETGKLSERPMCNRSDNPPEPQMFNRNDNPSELETEDYFSCDEVHSLFEQPDKGSTDGSKISNRSTRDTNQELPGATGGYNPGNTTNIQIVTNIFSDPNISHQYANLYGLPFQPKTADCIFNNSVRFEETKLCKILDTDCKERLCDIAKSMGDLYVNIDRKNVAGLSLLQIWQTHVQSNKHTWKELYDILMKLNCDTAAQQLKIVYEKDRLVSEIWVLRHYLRLKEILGLLMSNSVIDMSEKKKLATMYDRDENEAVDYFVELLIGRDHKYLTKFHEVLYNDRYLKEWVHKLVLCPDELD